jgi:hypothetical protein
MAVTRTIAPSALGTTSLCSAPRLKTCAHSLRLPIPPRLPEPYIYSPLYELSLGNTPTWNSPDIDVLTLPTVVAGTWTETGTWVVPSPAATLRNDGAVAAFNLRVNISWSGRGIGFPINLLSTVAVTLPRNVAISLPIPYGAAQSAATLAGLVDPAIYIDIDGSYDSNPNNNHGAMNESIALVGANMTEVYFDLYNVQATPRAFNLAILGPNPLGASMPAAAARVVVPSLTDVPVAFNLPLGLNGQSGDVTIVATDDSGTVIGGCTYSCYINPT